MKTAKRISAWVLAAAWMACIFMFSSQRAEASSQTSGGVIESVLRVVVPGFDDRPEAQKAEMIDSLQKITRKTAHFCAYALLGALCFAAFSAQGRPKSRKAAMAAAVFLAFAYACTDELHQRFVPGRTGKPSDVLIDTCGAAMGVIAAVLIGKLIERIKLKHLFFDKNMLK